MKLRHILTVLYCMMVLLPASLVVGDEPANPPTPSIAIQTPRAADSAYPAMVPVTGQTTCYDSSGNIIACANTGQDGDKQAGVAWPNPRFTDNTDGTVTDNLTGLIWLKNSYCLGTQLWSDALGAANGLASGSCGLSDGSHAGDWRLPNITEMFSLTDGSQYNPALPAGHPFTGVHSGGGYWTSTTNAYLTSAAWVVYIYDGGVAMFSKAANSYFWPVRGGQ
ncbi:MAG: DUF1566 domain-containing protein [Deltaproteobacteria bacterium]|nr:DUF1566 domain-containing protein [Deltaproteobacteria bacterium]